MTLEGNNYDFDTLLIYYQDGEINASQLIEHASEEIYSEYIAYLDKRGLDITEDSAMDFLDWWMDEDREIEDEDILPEDEEEETDEGETQAQEFAKWDEDRDFLEELSLSEEATKVTVWRYRHPMSSDKLLCATETGLISMTVEKWWQVPDFINHRKGYRFAPSDLSEEGVRFVLTTI